LNSVVIIYIHIYIYITLKFTFIWRDISTVKVSVLFYDVTLKINTTAQCSVGRFYNYKYVRYSQHMRIILYIYIYENKQKNWILRFISMAINYTYELLLLFGNNWMFLNIYYNLNKAQFESNVISIKLSNRTCILFLSFLHSIDCITDTLAWILVLCTLRLWSAIYSVFDNKTIINEKTK